MKRVFQIGLQMGNFVTGISPRCAEWKQNINTAQSGKFKMPSKYIKCCVPTCENRRALYPGLTFFAIPTQEPR